MRYWRFWLGRHLIHLGIRALPPGLVRAEIVRMLSDYADYLMEMQTLKAEMIESHRHRPAQ